MGAWGTGIYQNDVAGDIKDNYIVKLKSGKTDEEALKEVLQENKAMFEEDEDKYPAWCGLADTMWKYGRLTGEIGKKTIEIIEEEKDNIDEIWETEKNIKKRKEILEKLKNTLESEQPPRKKVSVHKPYITKWKPHEVYQYEITEVEEGQEKYLGWYIVIYVHKIEEHEWVVKGIMDKTPTFYMKMSPERLTDVSQYNEISFVYVSRSPDTGEANFQFHLIETSDRKYPKNMQYLGVCNDFIHPYDEKISGMGYEKWYSMTESAIMGYKLKEKQLEKYGELIAKGKKASSVWGFGIYNNEIAEKLKKEYIKKLKTGKIKEEIIEELFKENEKLLNDEYDKFPTWYVLADIMYECGILTEEVKSKVILLMEEEKKKYVEVYFEGDMKEKRIKHLQEFKEKLLKNKNIIASKDV